MFDHPARWAGFIIFVLVMLALDIGVFHRKAHVVRFREALLWSAFWIGISLGFAGWVWWDIGPDSAQQFLTGYLIEKSLSVDNLFVFVLIFQALKTPPQYQHRILFWGIIGAFIMRAIFIFAGVALIQNFHWMVYVFGAFLVYTGAKLSFSVETEVHPEQNPVLRFFQRFLPVTHNTEGGHFLRRVDGKIHATSLFVALILVETTDLIFAVDSIPAILAISKDPFIIYSSNVFAILGLRSLYFALSGIIDMFRYLKYGLSVVLIFVGAKMLSSDLIDLPDLVGLGVVAGILAVSILASLLPIKKRLEEGPPPGTEERRGA